MGDDSNRHTGRDEGKITRELESKREGLRLCLHLLGRGQLGERPGQFRLGLS